MEAQFQTREISIGKESTAVYLRATVQEPYLPGLSASGSRGKVFFFSFGAVWIATKRHEATNRSPMRAGAQKRSAVGYRQFSTSCTLYNRMFTPISRKTALEDILRPWSAPTTYSINSDHGTTRCWPSASCGVFLLPTTPWRQRSPRHS